MKNANRALVSVIVPVFNAEKYIKRTVESVKAQTYDNWELILVNDCSSDNSLKIILDLADKDKRIKVISLDKNSGTAVARNMGIKAAKGKYISFLDADDLWKPEKIEKQLNFMQEKKCAFSFSGYEFGDENAVPNGIIVRVPEKINYKQALKNTTICTCTVMFDLSQLTKDDITMPTNTVAEDTATWWKVLKKVDYAYGIKDSLFIYRRPKNSKSSNKIHAIKNTWKLYKENEKIGLIKSSFYFICYCFNAIRRRV